MANNLTDYIKFIFIQGKQYTLRKYSAKNRRILDEKGPELEKRLTAGEITEFEYHDQLLRLIVVETEVEWDVESDEFCGREAEDAFLSFFPPSMRVYMLLTGLGKS
ncbi:hypothetical protein LCGC14_2544490 [marine sediment metagenome]|uniref:Uncharacterized protein n=1 Tax=marine sediment metagenome TaxID=412755 RepID=A0A0F9D194_9ZZZZ